MALKSLMISNHKKEFFFSDKTKFFEMLIPDSSPSDNYYQKQNRNMRAELRVINLFMYINKVVVIVCLYVEWVEYFREV